VRHLAATLISTHHRRRLARLDAWAYFGSFGDDCFDDDDEPSAPVIPGPSAFCLTA
jgi:hypothetical protein